MTFYGIGVFGHRIAISNPLEGQNRSGHGTARHGTARQPEAGGWEQVTGQLLCLMFYALLHGYELLLVANTPKISIYMMPPLQTLSFHAVVTRWVVLRIS